jgi:hypothetical protein
LQEILNYPYLLWSKDVANLTTEALLRLEREGSPLVLHDKLPGVYLLIIHPNSQVLYVHPAVSRCPIHTVSLRLFLTGDEPITKIVDVMLRGEFFVCI